MNDLEKLGGIGSLKAIMSDLVDLEKDDFIIGYLFEGRDLDRIIQHETTFAARHLGGDVEYKGRPLANAHQRLKINRGHFRRRLAFLKVVLEQRGVDAGIVERWLEHEASLEPLITDGTECMD